MDVALKEEKSDKNKKILKFEYEILKDLQGVKRIPKIFDFVENSTQNFIVMELLGENVANYKKNLNDFTEINAYDILLQMIETIKHIHDKGYIHRDIKPTNFVMSRDVPGVSQKSVYMVDFGLAKIHLDKNGKPFPARLNTDFRGTLTYASLNAHLKKELSRRDDLWSFFFVILDLLNEDLPWRKCKDDKDEIRKRKEICLLHPEKNLFLSTTKAKSEIYEILNHLKSLKYEDRPDYDFIYNRIREMRSKELTRIFHQRYSSSVYADATFFLDIVKNNSNKIPNNNSHNGYNNYNQLQNYFSNNHNNNSGVHNNHFSNQHANINNIRALNSHNSVNFNNNNYHGGYYNNNLNDNLGNELNNNFSNYFCSGSANPQSQNFKSPNVHAKDAEIYKLAHQNLAYNNAHYNNKNINLAYINQAGNGNAISANNTNIWNTSMHNKKSEIGVNKANHINIPNNRIHNNNNNPFDFTNFAHSNNGHERNTNYANIDVLKNLYLDQIELESNKRLKKEELFNLNNLKDNFYSTNPLTNQKNLDVNNALNLDANNYYNNNQSLYDGVYKNKNNINNYNFENYDLNAKLNLFENTPLKMQQQSVAHNFINLPDEINNINNKDDDNNINNKFENQNNSNGELFNNGNSREINSPDSELVQSNKSKTNNRSILDNKNNENLERIESNENNFSNLTNGNNCNPINNNNIVPGDSQILNGARVPSLFKKDGNFAANPLNLNSNLASIVHNSNNTNCNVKETLTRKKRARKPSTLNSEEKKPDKEKSIGKNFILDNNNQTLNNKVKSANTKITPISKSDFSSANVNNDPHVLSHEELDSPLLESNPVNLNLNSSKNSNRSPINTGLPPNITNNNTNLSNNNQNQIFIINQYSKNNNLTELEKDLINYFINFEAKNTPTPNVNTNNNNPMYFNTTNNNINNNNNLTASQTNPLIESNNFDKILSKFLKENLLKQYIQSYMQNVIGNNMVNNLNNPNVSNFINPSDYMGKLENSNEQVLINSVLDLLKNRNCNNNYLNISNINSNPYNVINNANNLGLTNPRDKNNSMYESPVSLIFHKIIEQETNNNLNPNLNNKFVNLNQQKDPIRELITNNALNYNYNPNDLLNYNLSNLFTNNISSDNKLDNNFSNNISLNNNNNLGNLQNILNANFNEKAQFLDPRININSICNQNFNNFSNFNSGNIIQNKLINDIPLKNTLKDPVIIRPSDSVDVEILKNNFLTSLLKNEENLNVSLKGQINTNKNSIFPSEMTHIKNLSSLKKQSIENIKNYNNNAFNINFPNNLDLNLNLNENKNLILNDLDNINNANNKRCFEDEFLLLKHEIGSRENNLVDLKNLIPHYHQQNKFLQNDNFNTGIYNNPVNDGNYVLLYNLLKEHNNNNINVARNFYNN